MPTDQYQEIVFVIVSAIVLFMTLVGAIVFTMLYYQKKKFQHLREKQAMIETYSKQLLQARLEMQEETFNAISREIHDNVGQLLSLAKVQLNIADQQEVVDKTILEEVKTNIGQAMADLRDIAKSLSNERLQRITLPQAVEQELQRIGRSGMISCSLQVDGMERPITEQHKVIGFRMIQEALQNVLKHANASKINIDFDFTESKLHIAVCDNGSGFDTSKTNQTGLGLQNIINRAVLIGGTAAINSAINKGTTISLTIPYA